MSHQSVFRSFSNKLVSISSSLYLITRHGWLLVLRDKREAYSVSVLCNWLAFIYNHQLIYIWFFKVTSRWPKGFRKLNYLGLLPCMISMMHMFSVFLWLYLNPAWSLWCLDEASRLLVICPHTFVVDTLSIQISYQDFALSTSNTTTISYRLFLSLSQEFLFLFFGRKL